MDGMTMKVLICNERFLFRFGVDRALIILGKGLKKLGYDVCVMANRYDREVINSFASKIIDVPECVGDYINANEFTADWVEHNWDVHFPTAPPDIVVIGGWPFFSSIPFFRKAGSAVVFMDCGAVPIDGYCDGALLIQEKLRALRRQFLREATMITGISNFILDTQSGADSEYSVPLKTILLGADHIDMDIWNYNSISRGKQRTTISKIIESLQKQGKKMILLLGRWEPGCYKNSEDIFNVIRQVKKNIPECTLLVLIEPSDINIPVDLTENVIPLGFPDDNELKKVMASADLGISVSRWEGFNLPIVEMQWLHKPVLAYDIGAHPEVILRSWYLCKNSDEMAKKASDLLEGVGVDLEADKRSYEKFHTIFRWERMIREYDGMFVQLQNSIRKSDNFNKINRVLIDVTNAVRDPANSGVMRVTRRLSRDLQRYVDPIFVIWDEELHCYVAPRLAEYHQLGQFNGPVMGPESWVSPDDTRITLDEYLISIDDTPGWLLFCETVMEGNARVIRQYVQNYGINIAAIFYDAIPVLYPNYCLDQAIRENHSDYMRGLAECDVVIPISHYSADCLLHFWKENLIAGCPIRTDLLPGEFGGSVRPASAQNPPTGKVNILCVSTLEPRKNHETLINACLMMKQNHPEVDWELTIVGNRYAGAPYIVDRIQKASRQDHRIRWVGVVDDNILQTLYEKTDFTIYPSIVEGFGMPIIESIWYGKPIICSNEGVMSELASEGGCLITDVKDAAKVSDAIYQLSRDRELFTRLSREAINRKVKTWDEYTREFLMIMDSVDNMSKGQIANKNRPLDNRKWDEVLYPNCLCDGWQMNHSERMGLLALLSRINPQCSIEIGTYKGGSLSLISQFSSIVFSIDIDPSIPEKFSHFKNVSFLTGPSAAFLPVLLQCLDQEHMYPDFVLIDGDHSAEGVKRDIECLLSYVPKKPLFVMMHDSFNPECRRGMLEAEWGRSQYVEWVDLDFVPGRIIENDSSSRGEMWGGLALVHLMPTPREGSLVINSTAAGMYELVKNHCKGY
jgi:glycosyltransferase involved in cell wall biosynthesis